MTPLIWWAQMHVKQFGNQRNLCHFECKKYKSCKSLPLVRCRTEANLLLILLCWVGVGLLMCKQGYPMSVLSRLYSRGGVGGFRYLPCVLSLSVHWAWGKTRNRAFSTKEKELANRGLRMGDRARPEGARALWEAGTIVLMALLKSPGPSTIEVTSSFSLTLLL